MHGKGVIVLTLVQYNNVREKDRVARQGAMLPDGGVRLPDSYITSPCLAKLPELDEINFPVFDNNNLKTTVFFLQNSVFS